MEQKAWYKSKTIWASFLALIYSILLFMGIVETSPEIVGTVGTVVFTLLRFVTKVEIGWEDIKKSE